MEAQEEHVQTLLSMGFFPEDEVRRALKLAKNDLSDAVAILTNEHPTTSFDTLGDLDVDMTGGSGGGGSDPPPYAPPHDIITQGTLCAEDMQVNMFTASVLLNKRLPSLFWFSPDTLSLPILTGCSEGHKILLSLEVPCFWGVPKTHARRHYILYSSVKPTS